MERRPDPPPPWRPAELLTPDEMARADAAAAASVGGSGLTSAPLFGGALRWLEGSPHAAAFVRHCATHGSSDAVQTARLNDRAEGRGHGYAALGVNLIHERSEERFHCRTTLEARSPGACVPLVLQFQ